MAELQTADYGAERDYLHGSPHLAHPHVYHRLVDRIRSLVRLHLDRTGRCRVVELGAGHGGFTDPVLALGAEVVVTEMSEPSFELLAERYRCNPKASAVHDLDGTAVIDHCTDADLVLCVSLLHHVPDYQGLVAAMVERLPAGGSFACYQDPMWYPRRTSVELARERWAYYAWRITQGNLRRALATRMRRARGRLDEANPADMVEYHVVRDGVDEEALRELLAKSFNNVTLLPYWSTQSRALQYLGERRGWRSTFGIEAIGRV